MFMNLKKTKHHIHVESNNTPSPIKDRLLRLNPIAYCVCQLIN